MASTSMAPNDGGRLALRLRGMLDRFRSSLFGVPALWIIGAMLLSQVTTEADRRTSSSELPGFLDTTVDSARAILSAIASGTITAASVVFSLTLVAIQLASSVYSSRVLGSFLRDRFQQHMIGIVLGTFFYVLLVLREVRDALTEDGAPYIPRISVFVAVVLALGALLALLASISHTAQNLRVSTVTDRLLDEVLDTIERRHGPHQASDDATGRAELETQTTVITSSSAEAARSDPQVPVGEGAVLTAPEGGWVQQISVDALLDGIDEGSELRLEVGVGEYVFAGSPLLTVWPVPPAERIEDQRRLLRGAFGLGAERTTHQDVAFGLMKLEDIALKALSPGVNDPNTAAAVLPLLGEAVLAVFMSKPLPTCVDVNGRRVHRPGEPTAADHLHSAFDQIRRCAADQPAVQLAMVTTLVTLGDESVRRRADVDLRPVCALLDGLRDDLAAADGGRSATVAAQVEDRLQQVDWFDGPVD